MSTSFLVKDIFPSLGNSSPGNLTALGNTLFFIAYDSVNGEGGDSRESVESS